MASLWPDRWPEIALAECVDRVALAPPEHKAQVKFALPCGTCVKNTACLVAKRKELGPLMYDREILTRPRSSESSLFPMELFEPLLHRNEQCVPYFNKPFGAEERYGVCSAWDIAWSEKIGGDWLVRMTGLIDRQTGIRRLLDVNRWQRITFDDQIDLIAREWAMFKDDLVVIESDFAQRIWTQTVRRNTAVPVMNHAASGKSDFAKGVPALLLQLEQQRWAFPYAQGTHHHDQVRVFLAECEAFGWVDDRLEGVGEHDDAVMAWFHLCYGLDRLEHSGRQQFRRPVVPGVRI